MNGNTIWIRDGAMSKRPVRPNGMDYHDKVLLDQLGMVRVFSDAKGTLITWSMSCPNWASLMLAARLVPTLAGPYSLKYFNAGWFTETIADSTAASNRLEDLIFKSDVRLADRAYTTVEIPDLHIIPETLKSALENGNAADNVSVVCTLEPDREICRVEHVGRDTAIAQVWGVSPNSYPCLNGHSYDRAVTPEYFKVLESGVPHHDHVLASMVRPDGELHWLGYQRVILPDVRGGQKRVRVISAFAPVNIRLL
jgi:hypothetical protein